MDVLQKARLLLWRHRERAEDYALGRMWRAVELGQLRRADGWLETVDALAVVKEAQVSAA